MFFDQIRDLFREEINSMFKEAKKILHTNSPGMASGMSEVLSYRGKGVRAVILLLFSRRGGSVHPDAPFYASCVELMHLATLIHDDIIDEARTRRSQPAAHKTMGTKLAVLAGDFTVVRILKALERRENYRILRQFLESTNDLVEGEAEELLNEVHFGLSEEAYIRFIEKKTASLFTTAAKVGAILTRSEEPAIRAAEAFGRKFGTAFQILDDIMDYTESTEEAGKESFTDFKNGVATLPVLHFVAQGGDPEQLRSILDTGVKEDVVTLLNNRGSLKYSLDAAERQLGEAMTTLNGHFPSVETNFLKSLADSLVEKAKAGALHGI